MKPSLMRGHRGLGACKRQTGPFQLGRSGLLTGPASAASQQRWHSRAAPTASCIRCPAALRQVAALATATAGATNWASSSLDELLEQPDPILPPPRKRAPFDNEYLLGLVWRQRGHLAIALAALLFCTSSNLAAPVLSGMLFETLIQQQPADRYAKWFIIMLVGYVLEPILTQVYMTNVTAAGEKVLATLRLEVFRTLLMQRVSYFDKHGAAELTQLVSIELDTVRTFIFNNCSRDRGPRALLEAFGSVVVLFVLSWRLAPVCSFIILAAGAAAAVFRQRTRTIEAQQSKALQSMAGVAYQALGNMRTVRSFAAESLERERFQEHVRTSFHAGLAFGQAKAWFEAINRGAIHISLLALYAWGGWLVNQGLMPLRVMVSGIGFTFSLMYAAQGAVNSLAELRRASGALSRVREVLQASDPDPSMFGALPPGAWWEVANGSAPPANQPYGALAGNAAVAAVKHGVLQLRDIYFAYPSRPETPILQGLVLTLPPGSTTALVGRSGAGKSTVANLLSRFYEPQQGGIWVDGHAVSDFSRGEWARAVSMVSQDPVLFSGTIADNISYGKFGTATAAEIEAAARTAYAHEFISELPDGYQTVVGERGALLSGGQRQRIAIARSLLKDSPLIILDEATSALDVLSEQLVQQAVARLVEGRTVLVIAHRLSTIQAADQIAVMVNGHIIEVGSHAELSVKSSYYNDLMRAQEWVLGSA